MTMTIGKVAQTCGVSVDTLRYYERRGLIPAPSRLSSGYRVYTEATIERLEQIRVLSALGLTLDEIRAALGRMQHPEATCAGERWRLEDSLQRVERKILALEQVRSRLRETLSSCNAGTCRATPILVK